MARCDQGYLCDVCGEEVEGLLESDLYLRYVLGEVDPERLHLEPERHLRCSPTLSQFIVDPEFPPVVVSGPFAKSEMDAAWVAGEEARVTRGYRRLVELSRMDPPPALTEYLLPEARARWTGP